MPKCNRLPFRSTALALMLALLTATSLAVAQTDAEPLTVFVFAGQSNMVGRRSIADKLPEKYQGEQANVLIFTEGQWFPYRPGLGQNAGFGPEVSAAFELVRVLGKPVGIVKHAVGGTNLATNGILLSPTTSMQLSRQKSLQQQKPVPSQSPAFFGCKAEPMANQLRWPGPIPKTSTPSSSPCVAISAIPRSLSSPSESFVVDK